MRCNIFRYPYTLFRNRPNNRNKILAIVIGSSKIESDCVAGGFGRHRGVGGDKFRARYYFRDLACHEWDNRPRRFSKALLVETSRQRWTRLASSLDHFEVNRTRKTLMTVKILQLC